MRTALLSTRDQFLEAEEGVVKPPDAGAPWPFAIAVLAVPHRMPEPDRREQRLLLTLRAYKLGLFVLDVFEVEPLDGARAGQTYAQLGAMARRTHPDALLAYGVIDLTPLDRIAEQIGTTVRHLDDETDTRTLAVSRA